MRYLDKLSGPAKIASGVGVCVLAALALVLTRGDDSGSRSSGTIFPAAGAIPAAVQPVARAAAGRSEGGTAVAALKTEGTETLAAATSAAGEDEPVETSDGAGDGSVPVGIHASMRVAGGAHELAPSALSALFGGGGAAGGSAGGAAGTAPEAAAAAARESAARETVPAAPTRVVRITSGGRTLTPGQALVQASPAGRNYGGGATFAELVKSFEADAKALGPLRPLSEIMGDAGAAPVGGTGMVLNTPAPSGDQTAGGDAGDGADGHGAVGPTLQSAGNTTITTNSPIPWRAKPDATGLLFPDIYENNPVIDWAKMVKASHGIVAMKVRQTRVDHRYVRRIQLASKSKMIVIGYAFGYGTNGATQADAFVKNFPLRPGRIMALDYEHQDPKFGPSMTQSQAVAFVNRVFRRTGKYPLVYASSSTPRPGALGKCPRWVADWSTHRPKGAIAWQFTDGIKGPGPHHFPGLSGPADINRLMVTYAKLRKLAGLDMVTTCAVSPKK